jgi:hypothetical protein
LHLAPTNFLVIGSLSCPSTNKIVHKEMTVKTPKLLAVATSCTVQKLSVLVSKRKAINPVSETN